LQLSDRWIGKGNREDHTVPVRDLRTSAQALGLVRKYRGSLQRTAQSRMLCDDPLRLWWHIGGRFPLGGRDSIEEHASIVSLLGVAAGRDITSVDFQRLLDGELGALGWRTKTRRMDHSNGARAPSQPVERFACSGSSMSSPPRGWTSVR
jgi:hypothetical protein